ncbi:MAG: hypothetical protein ACOX0C_01220 [Patescibacteria group bacterium]|jgi:alpha-amylase/alpha-mannosidase (GH57 family)
MIWLNFLHFYQPANTEFYNIKTALDKSYWRLIRLLEEHPQLRMTANISGCLLERLEDAGETNFLERLRVLVKKGRLELTGSAYYHGFLPLLPATEVARQIKDNLAILQKNFGKNFQPRGFFLPEMAYSEAVAKIVKRLGYEWIIVDEITRGDLKLGLDLRQRYRDQASGLRVIFRERDLSNAYPPDALLEILKQSPEQKQGQVPVQITATDAELYGLRHEDPTGEMEKIAKEKRIKTMTISSYLDQLPKKLNSVKLVASSWESSPKELSQNNPYSLWQNKNNKIQLELWKLANFALSLDKKYRRDKNYAWYRWHLSRGLASCTFWWASAHDFSQEFGPFAWSPDEIERGVGDLVRSVRALNSLTSKKDKLAAERQSIKIRKLIWETHWQKYWHQVYE